LTGLRPAKAEEPLKRPRTGGLLLFAEAENPREADALWKKFRRFPAAWPF
jgi:hypothetical protein